MLEWFNSYPNFFQIVIVIAASCTVLMIIQIIMLLIGLGSDGTFDGDNDTDGDVDVDDINDSGILDIFGLRLFTIRNIIAFFAIGGWMAIIVWDSSKSYWWSIIVGVVIGIAVMFLSAFVMKKVMQLQSNGNIQIENAVGKVGSVYLRIPENKKGMGKVNVLVQDRLTEFDAMTNDDEQIATGDEVQVLEAHDTYLIVTKNIK